MNSKKLLSPPQSQRLKAGKVSLEPGESVGKHTTLKREEFIMVLNGTANILIEGESCILHGGESIFIGEDKVHNVTNTGKEALVYEYVACLLE
jgi:quercetin dioxygenase-like cupin family protein